jgi:hypothetical protein
MMHEPGSGALGALLYKFLPASLGAAIMVAVDPPATKRELFARAFVAFAASYLFGDIAFEIAMGYFTWLNPFKPAHLNAVAGVVGAAGWFVAGASNQWLKKYRIKP